MVEDVEEADGAGEAAGLVDGVGLKEGVADCEGEQGAERVACGEDGEAEDPDCGLVDAQGGGVDVGRWEHKVPA